jgi:hypothetical protein
MNNNTGNGMVEYMFEQCFANVYRIVQYNEETGSVLFQVGSFASEEADKLQNRSDAAKFQALKLLLK